MQVGRAHPNDLSMIWTHLGPQIRRGLTKGAGDTMTERWLFDGVMNGELDLWIVHDGSEILAGIFLQILERERGKVLFVVDIVAGSGHGFKDYAEYMLPKLREYGDMIGAYTIESHSRLGAARLLQRLGCKPKAMIMELGNGQST